jgi:copper homeostasis protein
MPGITLEVCVETVADALAAEQGGADRLELCSALELGGLTPSLGMFREVSRAVKIPIVVMIRPRAGNFIYSPTELEVMAEDIREFQPLGPRGFVFGPLTPEGHIHLSAADSLRRTCESFETVFHRAFDSVSRWEESVEELIQMKFTRLLTSGPADRAWDGVRWIASANRVAAGRLEVMPGGGVGADHAGQLLEYTGCRQLHGSFSVVEASGRRTCARRVAEVRRAVDHWAGTNPSASG